MNLHEALESLLFHPIVFTNRSLQGVPGGPV